MVRLPPARHQAPDWFVFDPLSARDRALIAAIMATPKIVNAMHKAWRMTLASGLEHSFYIYRGRQGLYTGAIWTGSVDNKGQHSTNVRNGYEKLLNPDTAVAHYHTHPTYRPTDRFTDSRDLEAYKFANTLGIIQTHFGFFVGRTGHRAS